MGRTVTRYAMRRSVATRGGIPPGRWSAVPRQELEPWGVTLGFQIQTPPTTTFYEPSNTVAAMVNLPILLGRTTL